MGLLEYRAMPSLREVAHDGWLCIFIKCQQLEIPSGLPLPCKKRLTIFQSPPEMLLTKLSLAGNPLIIPGQGVFGYSDIPAWDGKIANLFLQCIVRNRQAERPIHHVQNHTCRVTLLQPARRAAVSGQPSSLRPHRCK
jgi:hypothetical protein